MELDKPFAGTLEYHPRTPLEQGKIQVLRQKLKDAWLVLQPKHPGVVIDWYLVELDRKHTLIKQSYVVLFRDRGDGEEPAVIFYRKDIDGHGKSTQELYHIPDGGLQPELAAARKWWEDLTGKKLACLNEYLERIVNVPDAWSSL